MFNPQIESLIAELTKLIKEQQSINEELTKIIKEQQNINEELTKLVLKQSVNEEFAMLTKEQSINEEFAKLIREHSFNELESFEEQLSDLMIDIPRLSSVEINWYFRDICYDYYSEVCDRIFDHIETEYPEHYDRAAEILEQPSKFGFSKELYGDGPFAGKLYAIVVYVLTDTIPPLEECKNLTEYQNALMASIKQKVF